MKALTKRVDELERLLADRRPVRGIDVLLPDLDRGGFRNAKGEYFNNMAEYEAAHPGEFFIACRAVDCSRRPSPETPNPDHQAGQDLEN